MDFFLNKPYAIPPLLAAALNFALVLWIYRDAPAGNVRRMFILWSVALGFWNIGIAGGYLVDHADAALTWYRFEVATVVRLIPPFFLQFVMAITQHDRDRKSRWVLGMSYAFSLIFLIIGLCSTVLIKTVTHFDWGYYPVAEKGEMLFGIPFTFTVCYAFYLLVKAIRQSSGYRCNQMKYLFMGAVICFAGGFTNFLPFYGFTLYPVGNLVNSVYSLIVAYAIVKYDLMDIRLMLRRSAVYTLVSGALTLVYVAIIFSLQTLFDLGDSLAFYTAVVPVTVALAPTLKARIERLIGKASFWKAPNYAEALKDFSPSLFSGPDVEAVARQTLEKAIALFHARGGAIYLKRSSSTPLWERVVASGASSPLLLAENHPIVAPLRGGATEAVKEKLLWDIRSKPSTEDNIQRRDQLLSWTYAVTLPLIENGHLLGFLALEEKVSRAMYNEEDLGMLRQIGRPAAMILDHTLKTDDLKHNVLVKKKHDDMVMMGMVATEMAHELSRPLTHIMNTGSRLEPIISESAREGLAKIEQAAQRASDILDSFVMLSPENDLARETILMGHLMDEAIKALGLDEDSSITIERHYDASLKVRGHAGQVTQIYTNILQNAWQAMPTGGRLRIMTQSDTSGSIATEVIRLEDTGGGIPSHMLARVFDLFFTTKKDKGGRGVGLALSRAMVERHGGRMTIESPIENGRGTRVSIRFPLETGDTHAK